MYSQSLCLHYVSSSVQTDLKTLRYTTTFTTRPVIQIGQSPLVVFSIVNTKIADVTEAVRMYDILLYINTLVPSNLLTKLPLGQCLVPGDKPVFVEPQL